MELTAVIVGLEAVRRPDAEIILYSDSKYVVDSVNKGWVFGWERKNFEKRLNADLWIRSWPSTAGTGSVSSGSRAMPTTP